MDKLIAAAEALAPDTIAVPATPPNEAPPSTAFAEERIPEPVAEEATSPFEQSPATAEDAALVTRPAGEDWFEAPTTDDAPPPATAESVDSANESAEPIEVEAPPIAPAEPEETSSLIDRYPDVDAKPNDVPDSDAEPPEDVETVAARRYGGKSASRRWRGALSRLQTAILVLLIVDGVLIGWRNDVVRFLPQTASFYAMLDLPVNLRGLKFEGVKSVTDQYEGVPILLVEGNVVNVTDKVVEVPRLKLEIRNAAKHEIYSWTAATSHPTLSPGESVSFLTRLASPPPDGHSVLVRFVNRNDILADVH